MTKKEIIEEITELIEILDMTPEDYVNWHNNTLSIHSGYFVTTNNNIYACKTGNAIAGLHHICDKVKEL